MASGGQPVTFLRYPGGKRRMLSFLSEHIPPRDKIRGCYVEPFVGGSAMLRGRAVEKLTKDLPTRWWQDFTECPCEDLRNPKRVHLDPYGNVSLCQGLSMGNMWPTPLSELVKNFDCASHPICKPLVEGGPALLAREYGEKHDDRYVDACHFCYSLRLALLDRFPQYLAPRQVYGLEASNCTK